MVKIIVLLENTTESPELKYKHGLSLYVETQNHKILFDIGSNDLFLKNAEALGVNISDVDIAVISHGHIDHCGGLSYFLKKNEKAKIYLRSNAMEKHYVKVLLLPFYVGIDSTLLSGDRFVFTNDFCQIDDELTLFSNVSGQFPMPKSNSNLFAKRNGRLICDDFCHEQNLIITSGDNKVLICGCAHAGIVNIVHRAKTICQNEPTAVIGGLHLYEPVKKHYEDDKYINSVATKLAKGKSSYYTCHCTGERAYKKMREHLGSRITYIRTGTKINL